MRHRHQAGEVHRRVAGYDPVQTTCDVCGKTDLDGTIVLVDSYGAVIRAGSDCAARLAGGRPETLLHRAKWLSLASPGGSLPSPNTFFTPYAGVLERADELREDPVFQEWAAGAELLGAGSPHLVYRGATHPRHVEKGVRELPSYTPLASAAAVYSMTPGDTWGKYLPELRPTSVVQPAFVRVRNPLRIDSLSITFGDLLRQLRYGAPDGITDDEIRRILNYLHNRQIGKAKGGDILYKVVDEEGEEVEDDMMDILRGRTKILSVRDDIGWANCVDEALQYADMLHAETYAFLDAPVIKQVAERLGYDALVYPDPFHPGKAAEILFDKSGEELSGVGTEYNLDNDEVIVIETIRPLSAAQVWPIVPGGVSTVALLHGLPEVPRKRRASKSRRRR